MRDSGGFWSTRRPARLAIPDSLLDCTCLREQPLGVSVWDVSQTGRLGENKVW